MDILDIMSSKVEIETKDPLINMVHNEWIVNKGNFNCFSRKKKTSEWKFHLVPNSW